MRKVVLLKKYDSKQDKWLDDGKTEAWFHTFVSNSEGDVTAILEMEDGYIHLVRYDWIKFKDSPFDPNEKVPDLVSFPVSDNNG